MVADVNFIPRDLMIFIYANYPQYSSAPLEMIYWLHGEALRLEREAESKRLAEASYAGPNRK